MNYIERIQASVEFIESILPGDINLQDISESAYMSISTFYRNFYNCVGVTVKEYIRNRRIDIASKLLSKTDIKIIEVAFDSGFDSHEVFSRNFKKVTGFTPSKFRKLKKIYYYEKVDLMEKYFEIQDKNLLKKYPNIRVLKELKPTKVAYYKLMGDNVEPIVNRVMIEWAKSKGLLGEDSGTKIFGVPYCSKDKKSLGYEVWVTVDGIEESGDEKIRIKEFTGGKYALISTTVKDDAGDWGRLAEWVKESKYSFSSHQCLEELVSFNEREEDIILNLYMPIK